MPTDERETTWRPAGWRGEWGLAEVAQCYMTATRKQLRVKLAPPPPPPRPEAQTTIAVTDRAPICYLNEEDQPTSSPDADELEQIRHNYRLLRDCAVAPVGVWSVFAAFTGAAASSPFSCPWSHLRPPVRHDGHDADGFELDSWEGVAHVHGPRGQPGRVVALAEVYGRRHPCAVLVKSQGDHWMIRHGASASIVLELGRVGLEPPPGIPVNRPNNASRGLIYLPRGAETEAAERVYREGGYRFTAVIGGGPVTVIARRGVPHRCVDLGLAPIDHQLSLAV